jgi:hypothetical protein
VLIFALALGDAPPLFAYEPAGPDDSDSVPKWRFGFSLGALTHESLVDMLYQPRVPSLHSDFIADLHGVYTWHRFESVPLELEVEGGVAQRFGKDHQSEVDLISVLRWKKFPWNDDIYTNLRFGFLGASYVTGISPWEKQDSGNNTGSRALQLLIVEFTFAPHANAAYEAFLGLHHRSGIFGLIDGVSGGSNYIILGMRFRAD